MAATRLVRQITLRNWKMAGPQNFDRQSLDQKLPFDLAGRGMMRPAHWIDSNVSGANRQELSARKVGFDKKWLRAGRFSI